MQAQETRTAPRLSTLPGGEIRAIWDSNGDEAMIQFYPKGDGVVLDYIRVREGSHHHGWALFADALRAAGIPRPAFVESSPIISPVLSKLIQSGRESDLATAQRFWHIQALAFAKEIGGTPINPELAKNPRGNWVARGRLSYSECDRQLT
jgi:hypothetical protein